MTDYTEFKKLYLLCFTDDSEDDAELLFKNVLSKAKCICKLNETGSPIAMLFLMDANIIRPDTTLPYYYLYAACTHPDYRGRGIMGELLNKAKQETSKNAKQGIFLKPATASLFDFYKRYGFTPFFKICKITESVRDFGKAFMPCSENLLNTTLDKWYSLRKEYLTELSDAYVDFSKEMLTTAADGSIAIKSQDFGFVYEMRDSLLLVKEALCKKGHINKLFSAISHIAETCSATNLEIRLPVLLNENITDFTNTEQNFSVIWLSPNAKDQVAKTPYHGFAFD